MIAWAYLSALKLGAVGAISFDTISFESISILPDSNSYMNGDTYYTPKVEL